MPTAGLDARLDSGPTVTLAPGVPPLLSLTVKLPPVLTPTCSLRLPATTLRSIRGRR
jgi:hypothetical protein